MKHWIPDATIYQVNLRSLAAREPRNALEAAGEEPTTLSPLAVLTQGLDTLKALGITVVHLMPPFLMGIEARKGIGSPYASSDYDKIDPEWGTLDELAELVRQTHQRGMHIIIGMVPNHTSPDHKWAREHPEFYVQDEDGRITYDLDWHDTAKLNYREPALREAMFKVYDAWLSFPDPDNGIDGFRLDMAHFINDTSFWNETIPELRRRHAGRDILFMAECYGTDNNLDLFDRGFNAAYDDAFYKICEYFYGVDPGGRSRLLSPASGARENDDFAPLIEAWDEGGMAGVARCAMGLYARYSPDDPEAPRLARYTDNHDEGRGVYRFGPGAVRAFMTLAACSPLGMPFLLTGQEFGAENRPSIHERIQPCDKGRRLLLPDGSTGLQEGVEFEGNLFARKYENRREWYQFFRALIAFRNEHPALRRGEYREIDPQEDAVATRATVIAFERRTGDERLLCVINLGDEERTLSNPDLLNTEPIYGRRFSNRIAPFEAFILNPDS